MATVLTASTDFTDKDAIIQPDDGDVVFEPEVTEAKNEAPPVSVTEDEVEPQDATSGSDSSVETEFTVEEAVNAMGFGLFQLKVTCIVGFNWMADAFEIMLVSVLSDKLRCEWELQPWQEALITTFVFGGYFLAAPLWGLMGDKYGRKPTLILCSFFIFYFGLLSSFSPSLAWILVLRGLVGSSLGGAAQAVIILAEFLPSKRRGLCLVALDAFWVIGVCMEIALALLVIPTLGWRYLLAFSSVPLIIFVLLCKYLPESALYQQACGNVDGAMATLREISRLNKKPLPPGRLKRKVTLRHKGSVRELFKTKMMAWSTTLIIVLWFCNAFLYYGNVLLSTVLFSSGDTCVSEAVPGLECFSACKSLDAHGYVELLLASLAELPGIMLTLVIIETLGRRITMGGEMLIAALFTFLMILCVSSSVQIFFVFMVRGMISGAFQALYVYTPEVFPTHVRSVAMGICVSASRMGAIVTPFVAQVLVKRSEVMAVCVYGVFSLLAAFISIVLPVETKGVNLK